MEKNYEISRGTMCLIQNDNCTTKIIEDGEELLIDKNINKIVDESCKNFGSSLKGRAEGTLTLTGVRYKPPIVISEYLSIIMFPTGSTRGEVCHWFSLSAIRNIQKTEKNNVIIIFNNGQKLELEVSFFTMQNQLAKAARLDYLLRQKYE